MVADQLSFGHRKNGQTISRRTTGWKIDIIELQNEKQSLNRPEIKAALAEEAAQITEERRRTTP